MSKICLSVLKECQNFLKFCFLYKLNMSFFVDDLVQNKIITISISGSHRRGQKDGTEVRKNDLRVDSSKFYSKLHEFDEWLTGIEAQYGMLKPLSEEKNILELQSAEHKVSRTILKMLIATTPQIVYKVSICPEQIYLISRSPL